MRALRARIDRCFAGETAGGRARRALAAEPGGFGAAQLASSSRKSPLALALTFAQLRRGRELSIEEALRLEYRMVHRVLSGA